MNNQGKVLRDQEKYVEAEVYVREVLELAEEVDGLNSPRTNMVVANLAAVLNGQRKRAEAPRAIVECGWPFIANLMTNKF